MIIMSVNKNYSLQLFRFVYVSLLYQRTGVGFIYIKSVQSSHLARSDLEATVNSDEKSSRFWFCSVFYLIFELTTLK